MKIKLSVLFIAMACFAPVAAFCQTTADPIVAGKTIAVVNTDNGQLRGYIHNSIYTYKGIPYATAERFMAPAKPKAWQGIRSSMSYGPVCPTDATTTVNDEGEFPFHHDWGYTNENCQTLNVWTPRINDGKKRPVMVWFHGGGFTAGSSVELPSYDGESLARKGDVVMVSVNHRLNILGFLDLSAYGDKYKSSANAGLIDLVAALQWVKENIAQFGGDPDNVTIFGQSGGGGKVSCLMAAPSAKGLFHKAIVESGSYVTAFTEKTTAQKIGAALLEVLNLQASQVDSLQKMPYERLCAAGKKAIKKVADQMRAEGKGGGAFGLGWNAVLDGDFLPYQPSDQAAMDLAKNVPLVVGSTKNEFAPFIPGSNEKTLVQVKLDLQKRYGDKAKDYMAAVEKAYPGTVDAADYVNIDFNFRQLAIKQANMKAVPGAAPVYMYLFAWQSPVNDGKYKAMHCMELPFVFNNVKRCEEMTGGGKDALALADKMSGAWINFAKTGNPNAPGLPKWPAYSAENGATMIFNIKNEVRSHPDEDLLKIAGGK
ncbi:carboxylesterase/lipase family protein [soil metagenome]|jgi:para-nitrobenzyl esterase